MNLTPPIDYVLLGQALRLYKACGYEYVEVPWAVPDGFVSATLPVPVRTFMHEVRYGETVFSRTLIGSAEQGFLALDLPPGRYVGCTPCFRCEDVYNDLYQHWFMKIELYDNRPGANGSEMLGDAYIVMKSLTDQKVYPIDTEEGFDLCVNGIEVGSYGYRTADGFAPWAYGTGLALPRFSVASDVARVA